MTRPLPGELARYCVVGASGYLVNSLLFWALDRLTMYPIAFAGAFVAAATSNYVLNRLWTFGSRDRAVRSQYLRFLTVSGAALVLDMIVLVTLVEGLGLSKLPAAAIAILLATPASFAGNRLWTFGRNRSSCGQGEDPGEVLASTASGSLSPERAASRQAVAA